MKKILLAVTVMLVSGCQNQTGPINDANLLSAVFFFIQGKDIDPKFTTATGYYKDAGLTDPTKDREPIPNITKIEQPARCVFRVEETIKSAPFLARPGKDSIFRVTTYDFNKLSGKYYFDQSPTALSGLGYQVKAPGSQGTKCYVQEDHAGRVSECGNEIDGVFLSVNDRDRAIKAIKYIGENFCKPEQKPF